MSTKNLPEFKTYQDRDLYFKEHADYFTLVKKDGLRYQRDERNSLEEIEKLAQTKITIGGGRYLIYAVIGEQSAFVKTMG